VNVCRRASWVVMATFLCACDGKNPEGLAPPNAPTGFSPAASVEKADDRIARCNTVHSLTLPTRVIERYDMSAADDVAVLSCSLQIEAGGAPQNIPADVTGTATLLTGRVSQLEFKEILDERAVAYIAPFSIDAISAIDFHVRLTDRQTGRAHEVRFRQSELPGRR
jgi:Domain of unknown function (DUF4426)